MKKTVLLLAILFSGFCFSQTETTKLLSKHIVDSTYRSINFISLSDAEKIIDKPALLKDSVFKYTASMLRYTLTYIAVYKDSTSKGRIFFTYEQYKDASIAKDIFNTLKSGNAKDSITDLPNTGEEAFVVRDNLNYPFIMIRKDKKIFKFKLYYLTTPSSLQELIKVAKKTVAAH